MKAAINGFGRLGRAVLRAIHARGLDDEIDVIVVNDLMPLPIASQLLEFDSARGRFNGVVEADREDDRLIANGHAMDYTRERDPRWLPWRDNDIELVFECSGRFLDRIGAEKHLDAGARRVLLSAPGRHPDRTVLFGANQKSLVFSDRIISAGSSTLGAIAPVVKTLDAAYGIDTGCFIAVAPAGSDACLAEDSPADPRRARSAFGNLIPVMLSPDASLALFEAVPSVQARLQGQLVCVPSGKVELIELIVQLRLVPSVCQVNELLTAAAQDPASCGVFAVTTQELVSSDFLGNPHSAVIDAPLTRIVGRQLHLSLWCDSEWSHANRMIDIAQWLETI